MKIFKKKFLFIILITTIIVICTLNYSFALTLNELNGTIETNRYYNIRVFFANLLQLVNVIGSIISICVLLFVGIKYMFGSIEEKVEYKKTFTPYVIGAIILFSSTNIASYIYSLFN